MVFLLLFQHVVSASYWQHFILESAEGVMLGYSKDGEEWEVNFHSTNFCSRNYF